MHSNDLLGKQIKQEILKNELTPFPPDFWSNGTMVICLESR